MTKVLSMMSYLSHYDQAMTDREKLLAFELWCVLVDKTFNTIKNKSHWGEIEKYELSQQALCQSDLLAALCAIENIPTDYHIEERDEPTSQLWVGVKDAKFAHDHFHELRMNRITLGRHHLDTVRWNHHRAHSEGDDKNLQFNP